VLPPKKNRMGKIVLAESLSDPMLVCFLDDLKLLLHRETSALCHNTLNLSD
jgi:hypothetical protein